MLEKLPKYAKIEHVVPPAAGDITELTDWYIEEKVDGSQFRFAIDSDGKRYFGSKNVEYVDNVQPVEKSFALAVEQANKALDNYDAYINGVYGGWQTVFFAEFVRDIQHNTLRYDRAPKNNLYLFDVMNISPSNQIEWLRPRSLCEYAQILGVEPVAYDAVNIAVSMSEIEKMIAKPSVLGGSREGVVVKNYDRIYDYFGYQTFVAYKFVRKEFVELNRKQWKQNNPNTGDLYEQAIGIINKENAWKKAIQHARDNGQLNGRMQDMPVIFAELEKDYETEYKPEVEKQVIPKIHQKTRRSLVQGLPLYYKQMLYENAKNGNILGQTE